MNKNQEKFNFSETDLLRKLIVAVEQSPSAMMITDTEGVIEYANTGFVKISGYSKDELLGNNIWMLLHSVDDTKLIEEIKSKVLKSGEWSGEIESVRKNGEKFWETTTISAIKNEKGEVENYLKVSEDTSEKKNIMDMLVRSYDFLESVMNNANPIFVMDESGNILMVNKRFSEFLGFQTHDIIGKSFSALLKEESRAEYSVMIDLLKKNFSSSNSLESRMINSNRGFSTVSINLTPLVQEGKIEGIVGSINDITEIREAEDELRQLTRAIEQSPASVIITDFYGRIEYINPKFTSLTGYSFSEVIGKTPSVLKSGLQGRDFYTDLWTTILSGKEWRGEFHNKKKNGELYWEFASISPIRNDKNEITHFVAVKEDVTERKKGEEALKISEEKLREKNQLMELDLKYAQFVINKLLPESPPASDWIHIDYRYSPVDAIGGDFFSFGRYNDNINIFIGDVSGHGVSAALFLTLVKSLFERFMYKCPEDPACMMKRFNDELIRSMASFFLTAVCGYFKDCGDHVDFVYSKAGHPHPLLLRKETGRVEILKSQGKPLGLFPDLLFSSESVQMNKGDRLFLVTDGITESFDREGNIYGFERLAKSLAKHSSLMLGDMLDSILSDLEEFSADSTERDDIIIIGFEVV